MRAHLVQLNIAWEEKNANFRGVERLLGDCAVAAGDLVLLPEMFDTGFSMNTGATADRDGTTARFLAELATRLGVTVQGGRTVHADPGALASNEMTAFGADGAVRARYTKIHPFSLGKEHEVFAGGNEVVTYDWVGSAGAEGAGDGSAGGGRGVLKVCPAVCYDLRFPELFRVGLMRGAEVFAIGACWLETRQAHWRALAIARAIENQAYVLAVNRTGRDPNANYVGGTIAVGPRGDVIGELSDAEGVLSVRIEPREVRAWREKFPAWRDGRLLRVLK